MTLDLLKLDNIMLANYMVYFTTPACLRLSCGIQYPETKIRYLGRCLVLSGVRHSNSSVPESQTHHCEQAA